MAGSAALPASCHCPLEEEKTPVVLGLSNQHVIYFSLLASDLPHLQVSRGGDWGFPMIKPKDFSRFGVLALALLLKTELSTG